MRWLTAALGTWLLMAGPAAARTPDGGGPPCGNLRDREFFLGYYARYFTREDLGAVRRSLGIDRLPESFPRHVVDEPQECGRVYGKLVAHLAELGQLEEHREKGFRFGIFRYGRYYAVLVVTGPVRSDRDTTLASFSTGPGELFIFRASDLEALGGIAG